MRMFCKSLVLGLMAIWPLLCAAQSLKIKEQNGHISPVRAKITFANGRTREVVVSAMGGGPQNYEKYYSHAFFVRTEGGASKRTLWMDQIAAIRDLSPRSRNPITIELKDGTTFDGLYVAGFPGGCNDFTELVEEHQACSTLVIDNPDESSEHIDMRQLKSIEFLPPAKKDKANNLMFDTWRYSPFTGEKLPAVTTDNPSPAK